MTRSGRGRLAGGGVGWVVLVALICFGGGTAHALPDLSVSLSPGAAEPIAAGEDFNYVLLARNAGPDPATGVTVTVTLPTVDDDPGPPVVARELATHIGNDAGCAFSSPVLTCAVGALASGGVRQIRIMVRIKPDAVIPALPALPTGAAFLPVTAAIDGAEDDADTSDDSDSLSTMVNERAELKITKFVQPTVPIHAGDVFEYTIFVDNYGPSVARHVVIRDTLLNGFAGAPENDKVTISSCAFSVSQGGGAITQFTCTTGSLVGTQFGTDVGIFRTNELWPEDLRDVDGDPLTPPVSYGPGRLRASFRLLATVGTTTINTSTVGAGTPDPDPSTNMAEAPLEILPAADLAVTLAATAEEQQVNQAGLIFNNAIPGQAFPAAPNYFSSTRVTAGRRIQYTATVTNTAADPDADPARNVVLSARLPAGVRIYQGSMTAPAGVNCETGTPGEPLDRLTCGVGSIAPAASASISFQVVTDAALPAGTVLESDVEVSSDTTDRANGNNRAYAQNTVLAAADLRVAKTAALTANPGTVLRYDVVVQNDGPSDSRSVTVREVLPPASEVELLSVTGADCRVDDGAANELFCALGDLPAGARRTLGVAVMVSPLATPPLTQNCANALYGPSNTTPPGSPGVPPGNPTEQLTWDPLTTNNAACANAALIPDGTVFGMTDLSVALAADPDEFSPGQEVAYVVDVTNNGPLAAAEVEVVDEMPEGFTLTAVDFGGGPGSCTLAGPLTCALGAIIAGESRSFRVLGYVRRRVASRAVMANGVSVASASLDIVPENDYALVTTRVRVRNIVGNFGFEDLPIGPPWQELLTDPGDGQDCLVAREGSCSYLLQGVPGVEKRLRQDFVFNGKKGDRIEVAAFSKAQGVSGAGSYRVELRAYLANGWRTFRTQNFDAGTHGWQQRAISFTAPWNFRALSVVVKFKKMAGSAWFDEVRLKVHPGSMP